MYTGTEHVTFYVFNRLHYILHFLNPWRLSLLPHAAFLCYAVTGFVLFLWRKQVNKVKKQVTDMFDSCFTADVLLSVF